MNFYDDAKNVDEYIKMCSQYEGSHIYSELEKHLTDGKSILELGSGPGLDMPFLKEHYQVTGSDLSEEFLTRLKKSYPMVPFLKLNAAELEIKDKFDGIFSNKVLHHLTKEELQISLEKQWEILNLNGIIAHTFWIGEEDQKMEGLLFTYYGIEELSEIISRKFKILSTLRYQEFEEGDSLLVIAQKKQH